MICLQNAVLYVFATIYTVSYPNLVSSLCSRIVQENNSRYSISILFENDTALDYSYYGYSPKSDYCALKKHINAHQLNFSSLTDRTLFANLSEFVVDHPVFIIGIDIQQIRTLKRVLSDKHIANIKGVFVFDFKTHSFISVDLFSDLRAKDSKQLNLTDITEYDFSNMTNGESLSNFNVEERAQSKLFIPKSDNSAYIYKALVGSYPSVWIEKILCLQEIIRFLESKKIPHALPLVLINSNKVLLKERYIRGLYIYTMISYNGLCENLFDDAPEEIQREKLAEYLGEIGKAIHFYHFLGIYISDIKEDNFVLQGGSIIPIDADGFSIYDYPSSQPILDYRRKNQVDDVVSYYHSSLAERYSMSVLMYKIMFGNNMPVYEDDRKHSIQYWVKTHYKDSLSDKNKNSIRMWNALPSYIQEVFRFEFCNSRKVLDYFDCDEWYIILMRYLSDLKLPNSVMSYLNPLNKSFPSCGKYFPAPQGYRTSVEKWKRMLQIFNAITSVLLLIALLYAIIN